MITSESEFARLKAERDHAKLVLEDLIGLRSGVAMSGTEEQLDAHDARFARAQRAYERAVAAIERFSETSPNALDVAPSKRYSVRHTAERPEPAPRAKNT